MRIFEIRPILIALAVTVALANALAAQRTEEPPYIPTEMELVDAMLRLAQVGGGDVLFDLGSGDGRIVIRAARLFGTRGFGYEHQQPLVALSRARAERAGVSGLVSFRAEDLFLADISSATVVTLYLGAAFNLRLRPTLLSQLAPGARVVSNTFHLGDWPPDSTVHFGSGATRATIHLWIVPARVDGFWNLAVEDAATGYSLELNQRFQHASGSARAGGRSYRVEDIRIRGDSIRFTARLDDTAEEMRFSGRVSGRRMEGTVSTLSGPRRWLAVRFTHPGLDPR
jgi:SAM-dependent methyltransferase